MNASSSRHWSEVAFGDIVVDSAFGPRFSGNAYAEDGNISTLRTTDINEDGRISYESMPRAQLDEAKFAKHFLRDGDLVITRSGRVGTTAIFNGYPEPVLPGAFLIRFRLRENADPRFFCYWFNSRTGQQRLLSVSRGAAQQNINITNVKRLKVPLPAIAVQNVIASILSAYDDLIENNRRRIQLLEESARLLYREWFVRLRFPGHEHVKIIDGVPEEWEKSKLGDNIVLNYGKALKADDRIEGKYPVYGSSGIVGTHKKLLVKGPGIIVGRKGNVGSVFWSSKDFNPIDTVYYIDAESSDYYLYNALQNMQFVSSDAAVPGLNRNYAYTRPYLLPSENIRAYFENTVTSIYGQIFKLDEYNEKLKTARDLLLPRLMNGEIEV